MTAKARIITGAKLTPSSSQTVGPFFAIGLTYLVDRRPAIDVAGDTITIRGKVLDRDGVPVPDAVLEFWSSPGSATSNESGFPHGLTRACADDEGNFSALVNMPTTIPLQDKKTEPPHFLVLIFARGLLRHLISRVYFEDEPGNESDPVLLGIPAERRRTLLAKRDGERSFRWDVSLQGPDETVFFAW
jgi:protocatechuate 3,4-dioxygenase, alpha subunit